MLRGLRRVFSKGHSTEPESTEVDAHLFDEPVVVRPKSKSVVATPPVSEFVRSSDEAGRNSAAPSNGAHIPSASNACGKAAWGISDLGDNATQSKPPPRPSATSILAASPVAQTSLPQPQRTPQPAAPPYLSQSPAAGSAWGDVAASPPERDALSKSVNEREAPKHSSKAGGLFRSGSKNARVNVVSQPEDSTVVEQIGGGGGGQMHSGDARNSGLPENTSFGRRSAGARSVHVHCGSSVEGVGSESAARGGALRAGALVATPQAL